MKMNSKTITIILVMGLALTELVQAQTPKQSPGSQSKGRILMAAQSSPYNDEIVRILTEHYRSKSIGTQLASIQNLNTIKTEEWKVIVVLPGLDAKGSQPEINNLVKRTNPPGKVVVPGPADSWVDSSGIDAISSATLKAMAKDAAQKLIPRIEKILNQ